MYHEECEAGGKEGQGHSSGGGTREGVFEEGIFELKLERRGGSSHESPWRKKVLREGNSQCKGPEGEPAPSVGTDCFK